MEKVLISPATDLSFGAKSALPIQLSTNEQQLPIANR
jgi:hypothetical protein